MDRVKILCNKKTVYRPEEPNLLLVFVFTLLFLTSTVPANIIVDLHIPDLVVIGVFYLLYMSLYISLLFGPSRK